MLRRRRAAPEGAPSPAAEAGSNRTTPPVAFPPSRPQNPVQPPTKLPLILAALLPVLVLAAVWLLKPWPSTHRPPPLDLAALLLLTTSALSAANATHFLTPGAGLSPVAPAGAALPPHLAGLALSTLASEAPRVLRAAAALASAPQLAAVETHAGLRVAAAPAAGAWDYAAPYVDLVALRAVRGARGEYLVAGCCDCAPVVVGACAKSLCACLVCAYGVDEVLPLRRLWVWRVGWVVVPRRVEDVLLGDIERRRVIGEMSGEVLGHADPS